MKRRGFLFGLCAAPLVPAVASAQPSAAVHRVLALPAAAWHGGDQLSIYDLIARARMVEVSAWRGDWRCLAEASADRPTRFSGETPVGCPFPIPTDEPGWKAWVDDRNVEILRVNYEVATTPADSSERDLAAPCVAGCRREVQ